MKGIIKEYKIAYSLTQEINQLVISAERLSFEKYAGKLDLFKPFLRAIKKAILKSNDELYDYLIGDHILSDNIKHRKELKYDFLNALNKALKRINPQKAINSFYNAIKKHGFKLGIQTGILLLLSDTIIPILAGLVSPTLFFILHTVPSTEIAISALEIYHSIEKKTKKKLKQQYNLLLKKSKLEKGGI